VNQLTGGAPQHLGKETTSKKKGESSFGHSTIERETGPESASAVNAPGEGGPPAQDEISKPEGKGGVIVHVLV